MDYSDSKEMDDLISKASAGIDLIRKIEPLMERNCYDVLGPSGKVSVLLVIAQTLSKEFKKEDIYGELIPLIKKCVKEGEK